MSSSLAAQKEEPDSIGYPIRTRTARNQSAAVQDVGTVAPPNLFAL